MEENVATAPSVRSVGIKYGVISAVAGIVLFLILAVSGLNAFDNKWSWVSVIISIVILVFAHKSFKDDGDGFMSYGQGVGIGFWISLTGVVIMGTFTFVYSNFIDTGVMDLMWEQQYEQMSARGMSDDQIDMAVGWTKKLFWPMYIFFGLFFGVLIALVVSIFTQKKAPEQRF
jgi:hypothetical protein